MSEITKAETTKLGILKAARQVLLTQGYSGLTTRSVSSAASVSMSQIQYHFGSKEGLILAIYEYLNTQLLERQTAMYTDESKTLSQQWELACDYLNDDLANGYVRVLQELLAAGWANPEIGRIVREGFMGWVKLLTDVVRRAEQRFGSLGVFTAEEIVALVNSVFIGSESLLLLGLEEHGMPLRRSLRQFGKVIRQLEQQAKT